MRKTWHVLCNYIIIIIILNHVIHDHVIHNHNNINNKNTSPLVQKYPHGFEQIWNCFDANLGSKGSKSEAFKEFKKLKLTDADVDSLHAMILSEINRKRTDREARAVGSQLSARLPCA